MNELQQAVTDKLTCAFDDADKTLFSALVKSFAIEQPVQDSTCIEPNTGAKMLPVSPDELTTLRERNNQLNALLEKDLAEIDRLTDALNAPIENDNLVSLAEIQKAFGIPVTVKNAKELIADLASTYHNQRAKINELTREVRDESEGKTEFVEALQKASAPVEIAGDDYAEELPKHDAPPPIETAIPEKIPGVNPHEPWTAAYSPQAQTMALQFAAQGYRGVEITARVKKQCGETIEEQKVNALVGTWIRFGTLKYVESLGETERMQYLANRQKDLLRRPGTEQWR